MTGEWNLFRPEESQSRRCINMENQRIEEGKINKELGEKRRNFELNKQRNSVATRRRRRRRGGGGRRRRRRRRRRKKATLVRAQLANVAIDWLPSEMGSIKLQFVLTFQLAIFSLCLVELNRNLDWLLHWLMSLSILGADSRRLLAELASNFHCWCFPQTVVMLWPN